MLGASDMVKVMSSPVEARLFIVFCKIHGLLGVLHISSPGSRPLCEFISVSSETYMHE